MPGIDNELMNELLDGLGNGENDEDIERVIFKEYDEGIADDVVMIQCPLCDGKFPK